MGLCLTTTFLVAHGVDETHMAVISVLDVDGGIGVFGRRFNWIIGLSSFVIFHLSF